jgi:hypothetical protein
VRTVAVDFDGVLHAYSRGWQDGSVYDEPTPGALGALRALMKSYAVFVHTTRDTSQVADWIGERGILCRVDAPTPAPREFWDETGVLLITNRKYPAVAYIDDRAIRFENWGQALADLERFEPSPKLTGLDRVADAVRRARGPAPVRFRGFA